MSLSVLETMLRCAVGKRAEMLSWLRRSGLGLLAEQDAVRRYAAANL
jgi:hypothetical protein